MTDVERAQRLEKIHKIAEAIRKTSNDDSVIMLYGQDVISNLSVVSTGSILLDRALGVGGFPRSRITEVYGEESSGKCLREGAVVHHEGRGLQRIGDLAVGEMSPDSFAPFDGSILSESGVESTSSLYYGGKQETVKVVTRCGYSIEGTLTHRIRVLDPSGEIVWKALGKLTRGDRCIIRMGDLFGSAGANPFGLFERDGNSYDLVVKISSGYGDVYDLTVPGSHSYISNGFISHNSSIALSTVAQAQREGIICAYIDSENSLDIEMAKVLGVDMGMLLISQLNCTEDVFNLADDLLDREVKLIVVDSIAGTAPRAELNGEIGDIPVGLNARLIGQAMRDLAKKVRETNAALILINQLREKIGVYFGSNETTPGGRAIKFYTSIRLDTRSREHIKDGDEAVGIRIHAYVAKNKVAPPFKRAVVDFFFDRGFDNEAAVFDLATDLDIVERRGSYYGCLVIDDSSRYRREWVDLLRENPDKLKILLDEVGKHDRA